MAYNTKYIGNFSSFENLLSYSIRIKQDGYTGDPIDILLGGSPAVQEWQEDDPKAPVKGCTLQVNIINNGVVNLQSFYSNNDNEYLVELVRTETDETLFTGYIVQDECKEIQVDFAHEISILATDNLGLLKDTTLLQAAEAIGEIIHENFDIKTIGLAHTIFTSTAIAGSLKPGYIIGIESGTAQGYYTVKNVYYNNSLSLYGILCAEVIPTMPTFESVVINWRNPLNIDKTSTLLELIKICLYNTNINYGLRVFSQLKPIGGDDGRWLDDTMIDFNTFKGDNEWKSCYDILEAIMIRFKASLFQSNGTWNIIRWGELFYQSNSTEMQFNGYYYDADFNYSLDIVDMRNFDYQAGMIETGWLRSINRPYQYTKETFNYVNNTQLLKNQDLSELGLLINEYTYTVGPNPEDIRNVKEYDLLYWYDYDGSSGPFCDRFVRITNDFEGKELERIIVIKGSPFGSGFAAQSNDIMISKGDTISLSFDFKTDISQPGNVTVYYVIRLKDGTNPLRYLHDDGLFYTTTGYYYNVPSGDNTNEWHTVNMQSKSLPYDAIVNVYLLQVAFSSGETHYKNINFQVGNYISGQGKISGHEHKFYQPSLNLKNNESTDIQMDDSPKYSIPGTLFLNNMTGLFFNKTSLWNYNGRSSDYDAALGKIITAEELYQRWISAAKFNGRLLKINDTGLGTMMLSNLACIKYTIENTTKKYVFGSLSIDYKNSSAECTLWQMADSDQSFDDFLQLNIYEFKYLYNN
ncbi:hypothetical protein UFOVP217_29 [uncultured Caudovirales phage]|uniref:Uncharacterized protein n=1 Tax=uncultured Caudovirales phage TaxID=2100421 RepID=A0A6J7WL19_9CAUD|nr:hypothetical protein UFOVP217_29 [uncultured Caudovirales phage]